MNPKVLFCLALVLSGGLVGCSTPTNKPVAIVTATQTSTNSASNNPSKHVPLDFLADIPSMKGVSLNMSEMALLEILHQQKINYTHGNEYGGTIYYVHPKAHVVVIISFRQNHCGGIQRLPD